MKRLIRRAENDNAVIDKLVREIVDNTESKNVLIKYVDDFCENKLSELYYNDKDLTSSDVIDKMEDEFKNNKTILTYFVEDFLEILNTDEDIELLYDSIYGKEKLQEELFSKYYNEIDKEIVNQINNFVDMNK